MLGIIASTEIEADSVIKQFSQKKEISVQGKSFYKGQFKNTEAIVCICGVGKANAAHATALLIEKFRPNLIYIIGVGGAYPSSGLSIGDIVVAEKEIYGDEGLITKSEVGEKDETNFYTTDKINISLCITDGVKYYNEFPMFIPEKLKDIKRGNFVTMSTCTGTLEKGKEIEKRFDAICENMEGAAIAHICAFSGIPVAEIRGISNIIKDRTAEPLNKADIIKAARNAQRFLLEHIEQGGA